MLSTANIRDFSLLYILSTYELWGWEVPSVQVRISQYEESCLPSFDFHN